MSWLGGVDRMVGRLVTAGRWLVRDGATVFEEGVIRPGVSAELDQYRSLAGDARQWIAGTGVSSTGPSAGIVARPCIRSAASTTSQNSMRCSLVGASKF